MIGRLTSVTVFLPLRLLTSLSLLSSPLTNSRDHWPAVIHQAELIRLINAMFSFKKQRAAVGAKVTVLAGDVHL